LVEIHSLGILGKCVKYNKNNFYLFILFLFDQPTGQTRGWIFTRDSSKEVKSRNDVPFWVIKLKFNFKPLLILQNRQFWSKTGQSLRPKTLNNGSTQE